MHRRNLILRRFGALTFGLGYFEEGEWVDHTALPDRGRDLPIAGARASMDAATVHALLGCCEVARGGHRAVAQPIAIRAGSSPVPVIAHPDADVHAVARRSSAL